MRTLRSSLFLACLFLGAGLHAQSLVINNPGIRGTWVIRNATLHPVTSPSIPGGTIVFVNGVITAIGANVAVPAGAELIDGTGLHVYPGLIDSGTRIGLTEVSAVSGTNDISELGDLNANVRVDVALNPHSTLIPVTRVNGVLTVITRPSGSLIAGQDALIRLAGWTPEEMTIKSPVGMHVNFPRTRTASFRPPDKDEEEKADKAYKDQIQKLRDVLRDARAYARALDARRSDAALPRFDHDLVLEALVPVVGGEVPVVIHADLERDIRAAVKFAEEEELRMILAGGDDVQRVLDLLKEKQIPVLLGPLWSLPPREDDPYDLLFSNPRALYEAGIPFALQTNDAHDVRNLPYQAANAAAFGLPRQAALEAITIAPARIFGVEDRLGSLEVGKAATLFISDGDPLEIRTSIQHIFIDGEKIPIDSKHIRLYEKFRQRPR
ncbi:MAG TPA: amidohydrolase family protein [Thermoanaerobaculia bacterium]|nr:amidohydrolase family protein [Thermoanaerobaculia bacterium]